MPIISQASNKGASYQITSVMMQTAPYPSPNSLIGPLCSGLNGDVFIADAKILWKYNDGEFTLFAGGTRTGEVYENALANSTLLPSSILSCAVDPNNGDVYISLPSRIYKVFANNGTISTLMGKTTALSSNNFKDSTTLSDTLVSKVVQMAISPAGELYMLEAELFFIRKYSPSTGLVSKVIGKVGEFGYPGDDMEISTVYLHSISSITVDPLTGDLFYAENNLNTIRRVNFKSGRMTKHGSATSLSPLMIYINEKQEMYISGKYNGCNRLMKLSMDTFNDTTFNPEIVIGNCNVIPVYDGQPGIEVASYGFSQFAYLSDGVFIVGASTSLIQYIDGKVYKKNWSWLNFDPNQNVDTVNSIVYIPSEDSLHLNIRILNSVKFDLSSNKLTFWDNIYSSSYYGDYLSYDKLGNRLVFLQKNPKVLDLSTQTITTYMAQTAVDYKLLSGDGEPSNLATLLNPKSSVILPNGDLVIYDDTRMRIIRADTGIIEHYAGLVDAKAVYSKEDRYTAEIGSVNNMVIHPITKVLYFSAISPNGNFMIKKIENDQVITVYGNDSKICNFNANCGDGTDAVLLSGTYSITGGKISAKGMKIEFNEIGEMFILYSARNTALNTYECRIRKIDVNGKISTILGQVNNGTSTPTIFSSNFFPNLNSRIACDSFTLGSDGVIYIVSNDNILKYDPNKAVSRNHIRRREFDTRVLSIFGKNLEYSDPFNLAGVQATGISKNTKGDIYFIDNVLGTIRKLDAETKQIYTIVSSSQSDYLGNSQQISVISDFNNGHRSLFVTESGVIYWTGTNHVIQKLTEENYGQVITVAGTAGKSCTPYTGACGDGGPATKALLYTPSGLFVKEDGTIYFTEFGSYKIRKILPNGIISTIAGNGSYCGNSACGDGGPATSAKIGSPYSLFVTSEGHVYFTEYSMHRIRMIHGTTGIISTIAGTGTRSTSSSDGGSPLNSTLVQPTGITVTPDGTIIFAEGPGSHYIRFITPDRQKIYPLAGKFSSSGSYRSDTTIMDAGGYFNIPSIYLRGNELIFSDMNNFRVRSISANCPPGYSGFTCLQTCNGTIYTNPSVCSKHGKCVEVDKCVCDSTYYGDNCELRKCFGTLSNSPTVCSGHGSCLGNDYCKCNVNWSGKDCSATYCFGIESYSSLACSSHGSCIGLDNCNCSANYFGKDCSVTTCNTIPSNSSDVCSGRGTCPLYETCKCKSTNYFGTYCQNTYCNGIQSSSAKVCSGRGECSDFNTCKCQDNYSGPTCSVTKCFGVLNSNTSVCSGKGTCVGYNTCTCKPGYFEEDCSSYTCFGVLKNSSDACSGKGICKELNTCQCNTNRLGNDCSLTKCNGIMSNSANVCSGQGQCIEFNQCQCNSSYVGDNCQTPVCYSIPASDNKVCSGQGQCKKPNNCVCNYPYQGNMCDYYTCFGTMFNSSNVCSGNGSCLTLDKCKCNVGYGGEQCQHLMCNGILANDTRVCKGNGKCIAYNTCECFNGGGNVFFNGTQCENVYCNSYSSSDPRACSGRGKCQSSGCKCDINYSGGQCEIFSCNGTLASDPNVCNSKGVCVAHNTCKCKGSEQDGFWDGSYCESCAKDYVFVSTGCKTLNCDPVRTCNSHGSCNATSLECQCSGNWDGKYCDYCKPNYFGPICNTFCNKETTCNSNGVCLPTGTCKCNYSPQTGFYSGSNCEKCYDGFYGKECSTKISPTIKFLNSMTGLRLNLISPVSYTSNIVDCSKLIHSSYLIKLGTNPVCSWTNRENGDFEITLGADFTFKPKDYLKLNRLVFDGLTDYVTFQVLNADSPIIPTALAKYSSSVSLCDKITIDGSGSYGDTKPLKYIWSVVSSPSNSLATLSIPNSAIFDITSSQAQLSGTYKFSLKVESTISGKQSTPIMITVEKSSAPLPIVSIVDVPSTFYTNSPVIIKKLVTFPQCYYDDKSIKVVWRQTGGPSVDMTSASNDNLMIKQFLRKGYQSYSFQVTVSSNFNPTSSAVASVSFSTIAKPLTLSIFTNKISPAAASISSQYSDPEGLTSQETWSWTCFNLDTMGSCDKSIDNVLKSYSTSKTSNVNIPLSYYSSPNLPTLRIRLTILKDSRTVESTVNFVVPGEGVVPPTISLISILPQKTYILRSSDIINIDLDVTADNQRSGIDKYISRVWTLNGVALSQSSPVLNRMSKSPTLSNSLIINPATLTEGSTYKVGLTVTDSRVSQKADFSTSFKIATTPKTCPCSIKPTTGTAFETDFTLSCSNCQNADKAIQITYGFTDEKTALDISLFTDTQSYTTKLPSSSTNSLSVFFKITDTLSGAYIIQRSNLAITLPSVATPSAASSKIQTWTAYSKTLKDGDPLKNVFNTATISKASTALLASVKKRSLKTVSCQNGGTLDTNNIGKCKCPPGYFKIDCSMNQETFNAFYEMRLDLLESFVENFESRNPNEPMTETYLSSQAFEINAFVENYDEIDDYIFGKSREILQSLIDGCLQNEETSISSTISNLLINIVNSLYNYMKYTNMKSMASEINNLEGIVIKISKLALRKMFVGDKDISITTQFFTMVTNKLYTSGFSSLKIKSSDETSIQLPLEMPNYLTELVERKPVSYIVSSKSITNSEFVSQVNQIYHKSTTVGTITNETSITSKKEIISKGLTLTINDATSSNEKNIMYMMGTLGKTSEEKVLSNNTINPDETTSMTETIFQKSIHSCATFNSNNSIVLNNVDCTLMIDSITGIDYCQCNDISSSYLIVEEVFFRRELLINRSEITLSSTIIRPRPPVVIVKPIKSSMKPVDSVGVISTITRKYIPVNIVVIIAPVLGGTLLLLLVLVVVWFVCKRKFNHHLKQRQEVTVETRMKK